MANAKINPDGSITGTFDSLADLLLFYRTAMQADGQNTHVPMPPGYLVPAPSYIKVPDARAGDGSGFSFYPSIESALQARVGELANTHADQGDSDDQVRDLLTQTANDAIAYNGALDPMTSQAPALVDKYVKIFRLAVTPV